MHGSPKPSLAYGVRGGEALSSDPCITNNPLDAVGLKVVANYERADGVGTVLVIVADLVAESAVWNKKAKAVMRRGGYVPCTGTPRSGARLGRVDIVTAWRLKSVKHLDGDINVVQQLGHGLEKQQQLAIV